MLERVLQATNVLLNASVSPPVKDSRVRWTTYSNLHTWFVSLKSFLVKFGFAMIGSEGRLVILKAMLRWIVNIDKTEILLYGSKTNSGGRPAVSFHDPHFPLTQWPVVRQNPPSAALASLEAMQQGSVCRYIGSSQRLRQPRIVRSFGLTSSATFPAHVAGLAAKRRGCGRA